MSYVEFWGGAYDEDPSYLQELDWACCNDPTTALRLVAERSSAWLSRGQRTEAAQAAERVLGPLGVALPSGLAEEYLLAVLLAVGSAATAESVEQEQLELAQQVALELDEPFRYSVTALLWATTFGPFEPPEVVKAVLRRNEAGGDAWSRAAVQLCVGYPGLTGASDTEAKQALRTALARFRMLGDRWGTFLALAALADADPGEFVDEALAAAEELGLDEEAAELLFRRAELSRVEGSWANARDDYARALEHGERARLPEAVAVAQLGLARLARSAGDLQAARLYAGAVLAGCPEELTDARDEARHVLTGIDAAQAGA